MTIFEKIIKGELPADRIFEDEDILAIKDIHPRAPIHILIIPKKHFQNLQSVDEENLYLMGKVVKTAQLLAKKFNLADYRLITNNGVKSGQTIFHLHFHLLGGKSFGESFG